METKKPQLPKKIVITDDIDEIEISADKPRLIKVRGIHCKYQKPEIRHLNITAKGKFCLM